MCTYLSFSAKELLFFQQPTNIRFLRLFYTCTDGVLQSAFIYLFPITLIQQITIFAFCNLSYTDGILQSAIIYSVPIL